MQVTVERVSKFGVMVGDKWMNGDKNAGLGFTEGDTKLHAGDVVELTLNKGGFITDYKLVTAAPAKPAFVKKSWSGGGSSVTPERSAQMARGAAIKAVLGSSVIANMTKDLSDEEALAKQFAIANQVATYIESGE